MSISMPWKSEMEIICLPDTLMIVGNTTSTDATPAALMGASRPKWRRIHGASSRALSSRNTLESRAMMPSSAASCVPSDAVLSCVIDMGKEVTFNIKVTMSERWIDDFCSMLNWMQSCGNLGHSSLVGFYADGDGDFRPKFDFDIEYDKTKGFWRKDYKDSDRFPKPEVIYDAG